MPQTSRGVFFCRVGRQRLLLTHRLLGPDGPDGGLRVCPHRTPLPRRPEPVAGRAARRRSGEKRCGFPRASTPEEQLSATPPPAIADFHHRPSAPRQRLRDRRATPAASARSSPKSDAGGLQRAPPPTASKRAPSASRRAQRRADLHPAGFPASTRPAWTSCAEALPPLPVRRPRPHRACGQAGSCPRPEAGPCPRRRADVRCHRPAPLPRSPLPRAQCFQQTEPHGQPVRVRRLRASGPRTGRCRRSGRR